MSINKYILGYVLLYLPVVSFIILSGFFEHRQSTLIKTYIALVTVFVGLFTFILNAVYSKWIFSRENNLMTHTKKKIYLPFAVSCLLFLCAGLLFSTVEMILPLFMPDIGQIGSGNFMDNKDVLESLKQAGDLTQWVIKLSYLSILLGVGINVFLIPISTIKLVYISRFRQE